jgi:tetratricopeptide (TPR) repeat protein
MHGSGKTRILSTWVARYMRDLRQPNVSVITHTVKADDDALAGQVMAKDIVQQLKTIYATAHPAFSFGESYMSDPTEAPDRETTAELTVWLELAAAIDGGIVLVLDDVDRLPQPPGGLLFLRWLPRTLPRNVRLIFSVAKEYPKWIDAIMQWIPYSLTLSVPHLSLKGQLRLIRQLLHQHSGHGFSRMSAALRSSVHPAALMQLATGSEGRTPRELRLCLECVLCLAQHRAYLPPLVNAWESRGQGSGIKNVLRLIISNFQQSMRDKAPVGCRRDTSTLATDLVCYVSVSRRGLSEGELREVLAVPSSLLSRVLDSPVGTLFRQSGGMVSLPHDEVRDELLSLVMPNDNGAHAKLLRLRLATYWSRQLLSARQIDELPWLLWKADALEMLKELLCDLELFSAMVDHPIWKWELKLYWYALREKYDIVHEYTEVLTKSTKMAQREMRKTRILPASVLAARATKLALLLADMHCVGGAARAAAQAVELWHAANDTARATRWDGVYKLAFVCVRAGAWSAAEGTLTELLRQFDAEHPSEVDRVRALSLYGMGHTLLRQKKPQSREYFQWTLHVLGRLGAGGSLLAARCWQGIGHSYIVAHPSPQALLAACVAKEADEAFGEAILILRQGLGHSHPQVLSSLLQLASLHVAWGKLETAEGMLSGALRGFERLSKQTMDEMEVTSVYAQLGIIARQQNNLVGAERIYKKVLRLREESLGKDHPSVGRVLEILLSIYSDQGLDEKAVVCARRLIEIRELNYGRQHPEVAMALASLGRSLLKMGKHQEVTLLAARWMHAVGDLLAYRDEQEVAALWLKAIGAVQYHEAADGEVHVVRKI